MGNGVIGAPTRNVQLVVTEEHILELDNVIIQYLLVVECTVMVHQMKLHLAIRSLVWVRVISLYHYQCQQQQQFFRIVSCLADLLIVIIQMFLAKVDGQWGEWVDTSECSANCDGGTKSRTRTCNNPSPSNGGLACSGVDADEIECNTMSCPVKVLPIVKGRTTELKYLHVFSNDIKCMLFPQRSAINALAKKYDG